MKRSNNEHTAPMTLKLRPELRVAIKVHCAKNEYKLQTWLEQVLGDAIKKEVKIRP